ncbi:MAG: pyruvate synthase [Nitrososphaerota archaeon]
MHGRVSEKSDKNGEGDHMVLKMLTGSQAVAWAARLARAEYIPAYPITPQTEIIEILSEWVRKGEMEAIFVQMESEHSLLTAAGTAAATGARVFTATSSQGLLYGFEMLYSIAGWRAPLVLVNVARALAAPITLEPDHNDVLAARDSGFLQFHAESVQEALDFVLLAYRVAEDNRVLLPAIVNIDGFHLSFTRERVDLPEQSTVDEFLPEYKPVNPIRASEPVAKGIPVLIPPLYSFFKYQMHMASRNALNVFREAAKDFEKMFFRSYATVEEYMLDDADTVIVMSNSFAAVGKQAVNAMREEGRKVGLLRIRLFRPFPTDDIVKSLRGKKCVVVVDQNISIGKGGIICPEIAEALYHLEDRPKVILPVIAGLGGKSISLEEFRHAVRVAERLASLKAGPDGPLLLFREDEAMLVDSLLKIASGG